MSRVQLLTALSAVFAIAIFACGSGGSDGSGTGGTGGGSGAGAPPGSGEQIPPGTPPGVPSCSNQNKVSFELAAAGTFCSPRGCGSPVSILRADGTELVTEPDCGTPSCLDPGAPGGCPNVLCVAGRFGGSETATWRGEYFVEGTYKKTNGEPAVCEAQQCVEPGRYIARFCLFPIDASELKADAGALDDGCQERWRKGGEWTPKCVDVPFDFPTSATIKATL